MEDDSDAGGNFFGNFDYNFETVSDINFIPAASALDVGSGNVTLNTTDFTRIYNASVPPTGSRTIPFANFTTSFDNSGNNEPHISFNARNGDWLADELNSAASTFDCSFVCNSVTIAGPADFCTTSTFSVPAPNSSVTWSVSPSNSLSFQQNQASTTFTAISGFKGNVTITATLSNPDCGLPIEVSRQVYVGRPMANTRFPDPTICTQVFVQPDPYILPVSPGAVSYQLVSNSPNLYVDQNVSPGQEITMTASQPGNYTITLTTINDCGSSQATIYVTAENCNGGFGGFSFTASPNPATTSLSINTKERDVSDKKQASSANSKTTSLAVSIKKVNYILYDFTGNPVIENEFYESADIDVSTLKSGNYFLKIIRDDGWETHQIIIE